MKRLAKSIMTSFIVFIVTSLTFPWLNVRPEAAQSSRYCDMNQLTTVNRYQPAASQQTSGKGSKQTTITGVVVALGGRAIRDDDRCRQLMVVRATGRGNGGLKNKYLLVPRNYDCNAGDFTNETFQNKRKWRFPLIRGADCDATFEQIKDMTFVHAPGIFGSVPWMKLVPGNDGEQMSLTQKLLKQELCAINEEVMVTPEEGGPAPLRVIFDASASYSPCGRIVQWSWDFGDGASGSGKKVIHTYKKPGTYIARVNITDNKGNTNLVELDHFIKANFGKLGATQSLKRIKGVVVAYDAGIEVSMGGPCRRTIIFRLKNPKTAASNYVVLRRDGSCMNQIPEKTLMERRQRSLSVIRSRECDQPLDELLYFWQLNETGGQPSREPRLKLVPGEKLETIQRTHKLPCYLLRSGLP